MESSETAFKGAVGIGGFNIYELGRTGYKAVTADSEKPEEQTKKRDKFTQQLSKQIPFQNMWQTQLFQNVFQYNILDNVFDFFNEGYKERSELRREQNRLKYDKKI
ncbi:hypothetical protein [Candidatus Liberibacter brunswickensis]|uniref:hypothetical protein n=1 Tax=Candidatus Liberibacter brunswickensis TaxID=1968796 RepID=UPI002FDF551F